MGNVCCTRRRASRDDFFTLEEMEQLDLEEWWNNLDKEGKRDEVKADRAKRHRELIQKRVSGNAIEAGTVFLERNAVYPKTKALYLWFVLSILSFATVMHFNLDTPEEVDHGLVHFLESAFECGEDVSFGQTALAAFCDAFIEYGKNGPLHSRLPRARRALVTWRKVDPPTSRLPLGWMIVSALCVIARLVFGEHEALCMAGQFDTYSRPQAWLALVWEDVTLPQPGLETIGMTLNPRYRGKPSKTGAFDDTALIGEGIRGRPSKRVSIYNAMLRFILKHCGRERESVWGFAYPHYLHVWKRGGAIFGLEDGLATPHSPRHGGASQDAADGMPLPEVPSDEGQARQSAQRQAQSIHKQRSTPPGGARKDPGQEHHPEGPQSNPQLPRRVWIEVISENGADILRKLVGDHPGETLRVGSALGVDADEARDMAEESRCRYSNQQQARLFDGREVLKAQLFARDRQEGIADLLHQDPRCF